VEAEIKQWFLNSDLKKQFNFQLYVIQGKYKGHKIALRFALMKRRRRACYQQMFRMLVACYEALTGAALALRFIVTDFEVN
jgi:hypothetical protein